MSSSRTAKWNTVSTTGLVSRSYPRFHL
jgi:hypothetical protein